MEKFCRAEQSDVEKNFMKKRILWSPATTNKIVCIKTVKKLLDLKGNRHRGDFYVFLKRKE